MAKVTIVIEDVHNPEKGNGIIASMQFEPKIKGEKGKEPKMEDLTQAQKHALMIAQVFHQMAEENDGSVTACETEEELEFHKRAVKSGFSSNKIGNA